MISAWLQKGSWVGQCKEGHMQFPPHKFHVLQDTHTSCFTQEYLAGEISSVISTPQMQQDMKKTNTYPYYREHNESAWTLYTALGPEDSLKYRNSSGSNDIMHPVVLRSFQGLDYKHSLQILGEAATLRVMNNFKRKWEGTTWGFFLAPHLSVSHEHWAVQRGHFFLAWSFWCTHYKILNW